MSSNHDDPTSCTAPNRPPDGTAVGADGDRSDRSGGLGRRTFVKGIGASVVGAAGLASTTKPAAAVDWGFVGTAAASTIVGGPIAIGWALREFEIIGADEPPEGLTPEALGQASYEAWVKRKSNDQSTFVDNRNMASGGIKNTAYTEGKTAAIEALNNGASDADVQAAAVDAVNAYEKTIVGNLAKSWNETLKEYNSFYTRLDSHSDASTGDYLRGYPSGEGTSYPIINHNLITDYTTDRLPEGVSVNVIHWVFDNTNFVGPEAKTYAASPFEYWSSTGGDSNKDWTTASDLGSGSDITGLNTGLKVRYDGDVVEWPGFEKWGRVFDTVLQAFTDARDGIILWADEVTTQVNEGDIEISDIITPRQRASMMADGETNNQAISDLIALNASVDPEREAVITMEETGATLTGTFGLTDSSDGPLEAGTTYDPSNFNGDVFFTSDLSLIEGSFAGFSSQIDNGNVTLTEQPYENTRLNVTTTADESVEVDAGNWTSTGSGNYTYNATPDLSNTSAEVDGVHYVSTAQEAQYDTFRLDGSFTVESITNTQTGESVTETNFTQTTPQTDSNYLTQEDWDQLEQQNKELIEKYEQETSGGGIDLSQFDMFGLPGEVVAVGAAALAAVGLLTK